MTYQVVRVEKRKSTQIGGMQRHNLRQYSDKHKAPQNIDTSLSQNNISLLHCDNFSKTIQERVDAVQAQQKRKIRKDCPTSLEYVISAGSDFFKNASSDEQLRFFKQSLEFLKERHGAENVISAEIHMDEETPHMHVIAVPIRQIKDGIKLDPKSFCTPIELSKLHTNFHKNVGSKFNLNRGEFDSEAEHKTTAEHNRDLIRENRKLEKENQELLQKNDSLKEILDLSAERKAIKSEIAELKNADFEVPNVTVPKPKFTERVNVEGYGERVANAVIEQINPSFKVARAHYSEVKALKSENERLREENKNLKTQNRNLIDENATKTLENEKLRKNYAQVSKSLKTLCTVLQISNMRDFKFWCEDIFIRRSQTLFNSIAENVREYFAPREQKKSRVFTRDESESLSRGR